MGYSIALGSFDGEAQKGVAVGVPRAANLRGKVSLFSWNLTSIQNISGEQIGSYFGYAVIAVDFDGDRYDDLVVGAPFYTDAAANNAGKYDVGRVYVIYQYGEGARARSQKFKTIHRLDGRKSRGRFGLALAKLGDVDLDGYQDFAVGAPYDGPFGRGAVYIYHGAKMVRGNAVPQPSQIVYAEDTSQSSPPFTFGFSLGGAVDLDSNHYPDLIVGAYLADTVVMLKARPVIRVESSVQFLTANKLIDFDARNCPLPATGDQEEEEYAACVPLQVCFSYNGTGVRDRLRFRTRIVLDTKKTRSPRLYFVRGTGPADADNREPSKSSSLNITESLAKLERKCYDLTAYLRSDEIRDKLTAIDAEAHFELDAAQFAAASSRELRPILDHNYSRMQSQKDSISLRKNCGPDNVCVPDLQLDVKFESSSYVIGSEKPLVFDVRVANDGEDSFETLFAMRLPSGMHFVNAKNNDRSPHPIPVQCSIVDRNESFLKCDIGNPLPRNRHVQFKLVLEPSGGAAGGAAAANDFGFEMWVNSTNPEAALTRANNRRQFSVNVTVVSELIVEGSTQPKELYYNSTLYSTFAVANATNRPPYYRPSDSVRSAAMPEAEFGPELTYLYNVRNGGPSAIDEADVYIVWPSFTNDGLDLLYVLEQIETSGPIKCQPIADVNYRGLQLDRKKQAQNALEIHGLFDSRRQSNDSTAADVLLEQHSSSDNSWLFTKHDWSQHTFFQSSETSGADDEDDEEDVEDEEADGHEEFEDAGTNRRRTRREPVEQPLPADRFKCHVMNCTVFQCRTGRLDRDHEAWIAIRSRVSANTLNKILVKQNRELIVASMIAARIVTPPSPQSTHSDFVQREIHTKVVQSDFEPIAKMIPVWMIVLAIVAGILVLLLLAFCLKKCGFFNRKRPTADDSAAEREPLRYQSTRMGGPDN